MSVEILNIPTETLFVSSEYQKWKEM